MDRDYTVAVDRPPARPSTCARAATSSCPGGSTGPCAGPFEQVMFEPGGKDHSSDGGSYDTAKHIVARDLRRLGARSTSAYDFVSIKGMGGKISSSQRQRRDRRRLPRDLRARAAALAVRHTTGPTPSSDQLRPRRPAHLRRVRPRRAAGPRGRRRRPARTRSARSPAAPSSSPTRPASDRARHHAARSSASFRPLSVILQIYDGDIDRAPAPTTRPR